MSTGHGEYVMGPITDATQYTPANGHEEEEEEKEEEEHNNSAMARGGKQHAPFGRKRSNLCLSQPRLFCENTGFASKRRKPTWNSNTSLDFTGSSYSLWRVTLKCSTLVKSSYLSNAHARAEAETQMRHRGEGNRQARWHAVSART